MAATRKKVWFRWSNGQLQRVFIYKEFTANNKKCYRAIFNKRYFVLKESDYGKTWANTKEELL